MRGIISSRVPALVFGAGVAAALAFGATSAVAAPDTSAGEPYFCGFFVNLEGCEQCCGHLPNSWGTVCYCYPE